MRGGGVALGIPYLAEEIVHTQPIEPIRTNSEEGIGRWTTSVVLREKVKAVHLDLDRLAAGIATDFACEGDTVSPREPEVFGHRFRYYPVDGLLAQGVTYSHTDRLALGLSNSGEVACNGAVRDLERLHRSRRVFPDGIGQDHRRTYLVVVGREGDRLDAVFRLR